LMPAGDATGRVILLPAATGSSTSNEDDPGYELAGKETPSSEENMKELSAG
jgi:hypothetical protein